MQVPQQQRRMAKGLSNLKPKFSFTCKKCGTVASDGCDSVCYPCRAKMCRPGVAKAGKQRKCQVCGKVGSKREVRFGHCASCVLPTGRNGRRVRREQGKTRWTKALYLEYLKSPHWKKVRAAAMKQLPLVCQGCGTVENLCLHHRTYRNIERECIEGDLLWVCRPCHEGIHSLQKSEKLSVERATKLYLKGKSYGKNR